MHASQEDIKVIIQIFNPTYFVPIKGEYQHFISNMDVARNMDIPSENIAIIDADADADTVAERIWQATAPLFG